MAIAPTAAEFALLDELARPQLGLVTRAQLQSAGLTPGRVRALLERGALAPEHAAVYRTMGTRASYRRSVLAAVLAANDFAVASHRSALWLWRLVDGAQPVEITVRRDHQVRAKGRVMHRSRDLLDAHCTVRRGVPVTKPARTLVDAGAVLSPPTFRQCVELALTKKLTTVAGLRAVLDDVGHQGRNGTGVLRAYLDQRPLGSRSPESVLEPLMARLWRDHGVGPIDYQATLMIEGRTLRPDFLIRAARLVVEVDGLDTHGSRDALDSDLTRQNLLLTHGYLVLRYTRTHLRQPARVASEILATARRRIAELAVTSAA